jgi:prophage maintenance system killer protein
VWLSLITFLDLNNWAFDLKPTVDEATSFMVAVASSQIDVDEASDWLRARTHQT